MRTETHAGGDEPEKVTQCIDFLTRNRDSIATYIEAAEEALARRTAGSAAWSPAAVLYPPL